MWRPLSFPIAKLMILWLTEPLARQIVQCALDDAPDETCGLIAGLGGRAQIILPVRNMAADARVHYEMDHAALVQAMFEIEHRGLELIGIFHSHPNGEPIPSQTDIRLANYPDLIHVIVGLTGEAPRLAGWVIRPTEVEPVVLHIGFSKPPVQAPPLSKSHKTAIVIGAILAFAFMIVVSLSLLPPAPVIP